jgi:membrane protein DedA with SNARE-associated domain
MDTQQLIYGYGAVGLLLAVTMQTCIIPIPWELSIICATGLGMNIYLVVVCSTIGALLGGLFWFVLGKYAGLKAVLKYGKYLGIRKQQIVAMENFSDRYGSYGIFLARLLPFIPYKIFSIAAGLIRIPLVSFVVFTILGLIPRMYLVALAGSGIHHIIN